MSTAVLRNAGALNTGRVATHLAECLAVDFAALLGGGACACTGGCCKRDASGKGITLRMALAAQLLREAGQGEPALWQHQLRYRARLGLLPDRRRCPRNAGREAAADAHTGR
jgi:hypothetical protein